jgi:dTMP kinase
LNPIETATKTRPRNVATDLGIFFLPSPYHHLPTRKPYTDDAAKQGEDGYCRDDQSRLEHDKNDWVKLHEAVRLALARRDWSSKMASMFLSIDGGDGSGKSTQVELLCRWLRERGQDVVACRDPGSTPLGEAIRGLLLDRHDLHIDRRAEMLLYMAARSQMVEEVIRPALAQGKMVVSDRYLLANVVYQGYGGGLDVATLWEVGRVATAGLTPDFTLVLDVTSEVAAARMARPLDRMEKQGAAFHARVREGFLVEAAKSPGKIVVISAAGSIDEVQTEIRKSVLTVLGCETANRCAGR